LPGRGRLAIADKSYFLHERDEKGKLKPILVEIEEGVDVEITPIPEGEMSKLADYINQKNVKQAYIIISAHLIQPKITPDEIENAGKSGTIAQIVDKIIEVSKSGSRNKGKAD
jgi:hypothetical protein